MKLITNNNHRCYKPSLKESNISTFRKRNIPDQVNVTLKKWCLLLKTSSRRRWKN